MDNKLAEKKLMISELNMLIRTEKALIQNKVIEYHDEQLTKLIASFIACQEKTNHNEIILLEDNKLNIYQQYKLAENNYYKAIYILKKIKKKNENKVVNCFNILHNHYVKHSSSIINKYAGIQNLLRKTNEYEANLKKNYRLKIYEDAVVSAKQNLDESKQIIESVGLNTLRLDESLYIDNLEILIINKALKMSSEQTIHYENLQYKASKINNYERQINQIANEIKVDNINLMEL